VRGFAGAHASSEMPVSKARGRFFNVAQGFCSDLNSHMHKSDTVVRINLLFVQMFLQFTT